MSLQSFLNIESESDILALLADISCTSPDDFNAGPGIGTTSDWAFCTAANRCTSRHGDCDYDSECAQDHICGEDNCYKFWSAASLTADCCVPGNFILWISCPTEVFFLHSFDLDLKPQR